MTSLKIWERILLVESDFEIQEITITGDTVFLFFQLIASTSLYMAGKIEEQHLKLRDVVNVCYK